MTREDTPRSFALILILVGGVSGGLTGCPGAEPTYVPPDTPPQHPSVGLVAPRDHQGLTTSAQPTLYWHLSEVTTLPVELVIREEDAVSPLVLRTLPTPVEAGFQSISLEEMGVSLRPNVDYVWSIALVADRDHRSRDAAGVRARIRRVEPVAALVERIDHVRRDNPRLEVNVYAESGIWYDAIDAVSRSIQAAPNEEGPRRSRAALLQQVGLGALAVE